MKKALLLLVMVYVAAAGMGQNVGIGTAAPSAKLEIKDTLMSRIKISSKTYEDTTQLIFSNRFANNTGTDMLITNVREEALRFSSRSDLSAHNNDSILTIMPSGRIGINKKNLPAYALDVNGDINTTGSIRINGNAGTAGQVLTSNGAGFAPAWTNSSAASAGNVGFGNWGDCGVSANIINYQPAVAADGATNDLLGASVDISGSYAIAGAPGHNASRGAAYIYFKSGGQWIQQAKLTAADAAAGDVFGQAVAIDGDYAVVGAPRKANGAMLEYGAVYVFKRSGTTWTQEAKILHTDPLADRDLLGWDVDISGIYLVAGAPSHELTVNGNQGAVFFFTRSGTTWTQTSKIVTTLPGIQLVQAGFGTSVALSDTYLAVGADNLYNTALTARTGGAFTFLRTGPATWVQQAVFYGNAHFDRTGSAVSITPDYLFFGSPEAENSDFTPTVNSAGLFTIAKRNGSTWSSEINIKTQAADEFRLGDNTTASGSIAIVTSSSKRIYVYKLVNGMWLQFQQFSEPNAGASSFCTAAVDGTGNDFILGIAGFYSNRGKVIFGKVN